METQNQNEALPTDETSFTKGRELEHEFAKFMKEKLDWNKARVGGHILGKSNRKGAAVDIIAERLDERGQKFHSIALVWLGVGVFFSIISILLLLSEDEDGFLFLFLSVLVTIAGFVFLNQSDKHNKQNALVECKNLKGKVNINMIDKSLREIKDYSASGDTEYKFEYHYFVSSNGYIENALKYALEHGIICYQKKGNSFERINSYLQ